MICIIVLGNVSVGILSLNTSESQTYYSMGFTERRDYTVRNGPGAIFIADIDGDSDLDIITSNKYNNTVSIQKNYGDGVLNSTSFYAVSERPMGIFVTDLGEDSNNDLDIIVCGYSANDITILFNNGTGGFKNSANYDIEDGNDPGPVDVYAADIDNDGDNDLAVCNHWDYTVSVFKNNGNGGFGSSKNYDVGERPYSVVLADTDEDLDLDLITANYLNASVSILNNDGTGSFSKRKNLPVGGGAHDVAVADIDNDGDNDIVTANQYENNVSVLINQGAGTFAPMVTYPVAENPLAVFLGYADNDTDIDIITANVKSHSASILFNDGNGIFSGLTNWTVGTSPYDVALADFNLDGLNDIAAANFGGDSVTVLLNNFIPIISILQPDGINDRTDTSYNIMWKGTDYEGDDTLAVDLYYIYYIIKQNVTHEIKSPIILGTKNDGIYNWNTADMEEGSYQIFGAIKDDHGGLGFNYSIGNVTIFHNALPTITLRTPPAEGAKADTSFVIRWKDSDLDDDAVINLYTDKDKKYNNGNEQLIVGNLSEDSKDDYYFWLTADVAEGEYYILGDISDSFGEKNYNYSLGKLRVDHNIENNTAPDIVVLEPDGADDKADSSFFITWWDYDPDDNAVISLFYDSDNQDLDGTKIVDALSEDSDINEFHWQTFSIPNGSYYIYAKIEDTKNAPVYNYSVGPLNITHPTHNIPPWLSLDEPDGLEDEADLTYEIKWTDSDPDDNAEITLYYNTVNLMSDGFEIIKGLREDDGANSYVWDTSEIPAGKYYIYAMINDFRNAPVFNISDGQVVIDHYVPPTHPNNNNKNNSPPSITILEPDGINDFANTSYLIQWEDDDLEDDAFIALYYDSDNFGLDGRLIVDKLSEDGLMDYYVWNTTGVQEGSYYVYGMITDLVNAPFYNYSIGNLTIIHNRTWNGDGEEPPIIGEVEAVITSPLAAQTYLTTDQILFDGSRSLGVNLSYYWHSSGDGYLSDRPIFTRNLSAGTHVIILEVIDNDLQRSTIEINIDVEAPSSKDDDNLTNQIAIVTFLFIIIITIIIFISLMRKRSIEPEPVKPKKAAKPVKSKKTLKKEPSNPREN